MEDMALRRRLRKEETAGTTHRNPEEGRRWLYREIFWDQPHVSRMDPEELRKYLEANRHNRFVYDDLLRRFIERGSLTEAVSFFPLEEIERGLNTFRFWVNVPEWRLRAWQRAVKELKHERDNPAGV